MRRHHATYPALVLLLACAPSAPRSPSPAGGGAGLIAALREDDIRRDLFALAGDAMRGREAGTVDELRASMWLAEQARKAGLEPAGEDGTYFQFFPLRRATQSAGSRVSLAGQALVLWSDVALLGLANADLDAPVVWLGEAGASDAARHDVAGRVAAVMMRSADAPAPDDALAARRYVAAAANRIARPLVERGAVAVLIVADPAADALFDIAATNAMRGRYALDEGAPLAVPVQAPTLVLRQRWLGAAARPGTRLTARLTVDDFVYPSVNVVARVPGSDARLRDQHVLFSAHQDHDGVRAPIAGDSIWNGADDNASVAVGVLAIARAFVQRPGRRSALFVWHGAEEKGLFGSRWHAAHPMVPKQSIVAVLNADMIGRNHPDTAALLGVVPPHRSSTDLARMALEANDRHIRFVIDSTWDRPEHREGWFFRSDHLPYARENIPSIYFSSLLHADYHTPRDGPDRIDVAKLTRIARWMYATGWTVANAEQPPRLDPGFRLER